MNPTVATVPAALVKLSAGTDAVLTDKGAVLLRHGAAPVHLTKPEVDRLATAWRERKVGDE